MKASRNFCNPVLLIGSIYGQIIKLNCKKAIFFVLQFK